MRLLTLIHPYYENPAMFREQQRRWRALPDDIKQHLHVVVVDDGSPTSPAKDVLEPTEIASMRLFRTLVDVRWNWLFCRNLGMSQARTDWGHMTDMDHAVPEPTLRWMMTADLGPQTVYRFGRVDLPDRTIVHGHPNSWLMTREMFDRVGGYDERFSGYYGTDWDFRDRVAMRALRVVHRPEVLERYGSAVIADAETQAYGRKEDQDREHVNRIKGERAALGEWRPLRLTFPWEQVA